MHVRVPATNPRGLAVSACAALALAGGGVAALGGSAQAARGQGASGASQLEVLPYPGLSRIATPKFPHRRAI